MFNFPQCPLVKHNIKQGGKKLLKKTAQSNNWGDNTYLKEAKQSVSSAETLLLVLTEEASFCWWSFYSTSFLPEKMPKHCQKTKSEKIEKALKTLMTAKDVPRNHSITLPHCGELLPPMLSPGGCLGS